MIIFSLNISDCLIHIYCSGAMARDSTELPCQAYLVPFLVSTKKIAFCFHIFVLCRVEPLYLVASLILALGSLL